MSEQTTIPDQEDILAANERLETENTRLSGEVSAATELLETSQEQCTKAQGQVDELTKKIATLQIAAKAAGQELKRLQDENATLATKMEDFNKSVAAEVAKLGLRSKAAEHKEVPEDADLTPTQRVMAAKGVQSLAELRQKR
jgi:predicted  nucleic acid-binding Zn-ribbon protein